MHSFPEDQISSTGQKFWSGSKRCQKPIVFNMNTTCSDAGMHNHFDFMVAAANLRAQMFDINGHQDEDFFKKVLADIYRS